MHGKAGRSFLKLAPERKIAYRTKEKRQERPVFCFVAVSKVDEEKSDRKFGGCSFVYRMRTQNLKAPEKSGRQRL